MSILLVLVDFGQNRELVMDPLSPKIAVQYIEKAIVVTLNEEKILEEMEIQALEDIIMPLISAGKPTKLVIDFSNVKFLSSAVLGLLIRISKKIYESNGQLRLCCIERNISKIFKITRLDKVFDIFEDQSEAIDSLI